MGAKEGGISGVSLGGVVGGEDRASLVGDGSVVGSRGGGLEERGAELDGVGEERRLHKLPNGGGVESFAPVACRSLARAAWPKATFAAQVGIEEPEAAAAVGTRLSVQRIIPIWTITRTAMVRPVKRLSVISTSSSRRSDERRGRLIGTPRSQGGPPLSLACQFVQRVGVIQRPSRMRKEVAVDWPPPGDSKRLRSTRRPVQFSEAWMPAPIYR